jgi:hypothetical protein
VITAGRSDALRRKAASVEDVAYFLIALLGLGPIPLVLIVRRRGRVHPWRIATALLLVVVTGIGAWFLHDLRSLPDWSNSNVGGAFIVH